MRMMAQLALPKMSCIRRLGRKSRYNFGSSKPVLNALPTSGHALKVPKQRSSIICKMLVNDGYTGNFQVNKSQESSNVFAVNQNTHSSYLPAPKLLLKCDRMILIENITQPIMRLYQSRPHLIQIQQSNLPMAVVGALKCACSEIRDLSWVRIAQATKLTAWRSKEYQGNLKALQSEPVHLRLLTNETFIEPSRMVAICRNFSKAGGKSTPILNCLRHLHYILALL